MLQQTLNKIIKKHSKPDSGEAIIGMIIGALLFTTFLITIIDTSVYFLNRSVIDNTTIDGARTVGIYGGNGDERRQTVIERAYGENRDTICNSPDVTDAFDKSQVRIARLSAVECGIKRQLSNSPLVGVRIQTIECGPRVSRHIGSRTYCEVSWDYSGIPGSFLNLIQDFNADSSGNITGKTHALASADTDTQVYSRQQGRNGSYMGKHISVGHSETEVDMTSIDLVGR